MGTGAVGRMRQRARIRLVAASAVVLGGSALLAGCTTRTVVLTNTSAEPATLSSTGATDGWDYERTLAPGESFEFKIGASQPINMPGLTIQVR